MTLGRMYYKIPWLLGGNKMKSEKYLDLAKSINPSWIPLKRYLAETYYSLEMYDKAQDALSALADVSPAFEDYQEFADELYYGCHFARKWGWKDVVTKIKEERILFLTAHQHLPLMNIENAKLPEELQSKDCEV